MVINFNISTKAELTLRPNSPCKGLLTSQSFDVEPAEFIKQVGYILEDWNEGRNPFSVELMKHGLSKVINLAVCACIDKMMQKKYGNETVTEGNSTWSKWYAEAEKVYETIRVDVCSIEAASAWVEAEP